MNNHRSVFVLQHADKKVKFVYLAVIDLCLVSSVTFPFIRNRISVFRFKNT